MSRKSGHDPVKLETILYALKTSPHGSWVRDIAKKTGLKKSTVAHYIKKHLKDKIEVVHDSKHIKIIKLKHPVEEKKIKRKEKFIEVQQEQELIEHREQPREIPDYVS